MIWSAGADHLNEKNEIAYHTPGVIEGIKKMRKQRHLKAVIDLLPALKSPTVSKLFGEDGYACEAVVAKHDINTLIPALKDAGATGNSGLQHCDLAAGIEYHPDIVHIIETATDAWQTGAEFHANADKGRRAPGAAPRLRLPPAGCARRCCRAR